MPHGVWLKPQRRTAFAFRSDERLRGPLPRTGERPYAWRTTLRPQYIASSWACVDPEALVEPAHAAATACNADESVVCGEVAAVGGVKPRTIGGRAWAAPIRVRRTRCPFAANPARSCLDFYIQVGKSALYALRGVISSNTPGFSRAERSPGSRPRTRARTARRTIFALRVFGRAETKTTRSGLKALPSSAATASETSRAQAGVASLSGRSTQKIHATSPLTPFGATPTRPPAAAAAGRGRAGRT